MCVGLYGLCLVGMCGGDGLCVCFGVVCGLCVCGLVVGGLPGLVCVEAMVCGLYGGGCGVVVVFPGLEYGLLYGVVLVCGDVLGGTDDGVGAVEVYDAIVVDVDGCGLELSEGVVLVEYGLSIGVGLLYTLSQVVVGVCGGGCAVACGAGCLCFVDLS